MRKFVVSLVLLLIVAAVVFYFGWIQFQIPEDRVGVVFTKTSGWDSAPVQPGDFHWRWENLLPTNLTLHLFSTQPYSTTVRSSGSLPSGDLYRRYLEGDVDFSYAVELRLRFRARTDELPLLVAREGLVPDQLDDWYAEHADAMVKRGLELVDEFFDGLDQDQSFSVARFTDHVRAGLEREFPDLEIIRVLPTEVRVPDLRLYAAARSVYLDVLDARSEATAAAAFDAAGDEVRRESRLAVLRRYGEILKEFPILLEYFSLSADKGIDPLDLDVLQTLGALP
ncbi:MAG: hypothetical protein EA404_04630 [Spirochaetaceae bacterium]|nr:MAG: hypothetical protein EA404_04630 [Spirochaetaceae bacterium]